MAAVETKDARTSGHGERVARLCDVIAGAMGLNHTDIASLRYAGMLHDVEASWRFQVACSARSTASMRSELAASGSTPRVEPTSCAISSSSLRH